MADTTTKHWDFEISHEGDQKFLVTPANNDKFVISAREAAYACANASTIFEWQDEMLQIMHKVSDWAGARAEMIDAVWFGIMERMVVFLVVPSAREMNFDLNDQIATFECDLAVEFKRCKFEIRQFPGYDRESLSCVLDMNQAIPIYGKPTRAPEAVDSQS